ncbi:MAG: hypothetical protein E7240_03750 [Lachnospiraceae bacterium]|nr:hypothetical protein [Lachnospiraceae bacterium]
MARYIKGTGSERKLCTWRCVHCNHQNTGIAVISVTAQQSYGLIGTTRSKAETNVKNFVKDEIVKKARKVNEERIIPEGVGIDGKCASCGQLQPWTKANAFPVLRMIGGIILGILMAVLLSPYLTKVDNGDIFSFFLHFMTVVLVAWGVDTGVKKIQQVIISKKMSAYGDEYFPKLIDIPEQQG